MPCVGSVLCRSASPRFCAARPWPSSRCREGFNRHHVIRAKIRREGMRGRDAKQIGLAIVGGGRVGLFRGEVAARHPSVGWIGLAEKNPNRGGDVAARIGADFVTTDHRELLRRPEVTAAIIATDEHLHVDPVLAAVERGVPMLIEKPLATDLAQSARVLKAITDAKLDAVVGYTQRFRRKWLGAKEKVP